MEGWLNLAPSLGLDSCFLGSLGPLLPSPIPAQVGWPGWGGGARHRSVLAGQGLYNVVKDSPLDQRLPLQRAGDHLGSLLQTEEVCRRTRILCF